MNRSDAIHLLNRLLQILNGSLASYLKDAQPWTRRNGEKARETLAALAADQERFANRVAEAIGQRRGRIDPGCFPIAFTSIHDLALDFLLQKTLECHVRDLEAIRHCAADLTNEPTLRPLTEDLVANQVKHLDTLRELMNDDEFVEQQAAGSRQPESRL